MNFQTMDGGFHVAGDKCPNCSVFWEYCPCCETAYCPDCGLLEQDVEEQEAEEE